MCSVCCRVLTQVFLCRLSTHSHAFARINITTYSKHIPLRTLIPYPHFFPLLRTWFTAILDIIGSGHLIILASKSFRQQERTRSVERIHFPQKASSWPLVLEELCLFAFDFEIYLVLFIYLCELIFSWNKL